jgi:hypothetical protein
VLGLIDESAPESPRGVHYIIGAAVLLEPGRRDEVRQRISMLTGERRRPFHWKDEGVEKRATMLALLGELDVGIFATIHHPVPATRQVAARHRSLTELLVVLDREGVDKLLIESRGLQDLQDQQTVLDARRHGLIDRDIRYRFGDKHDPLLWLPDAVAGLLSEAESRKTDHWIAELQRIAHIFAVRRLDR